jgi:hypothetical protein
MIVTNDWWMVLDRSNERIVYRSTSPLEAFRLARRSAGGAVRLATAPGYGVSVTGRRGTVTVIRVPSNPAQAKRRVAIPISSMGEQVHLPDGSRFTWIPAAAAAPVRAIPATTQPARRKTPASARARGAR